MKKLLPLVVIKEAFLIVLIGGVVGIGANLLNPDGVKISSVRPPIEYADDSVIAQDLSPIRIDSTNHEVLDADSESAGPAIINIAQMEKLISHKKATLIDARSVKEYQQGHIPGAINIPYESMEKYITKIDSLSRDNWVVCFCDGPPCDLGELLANELFGMGFPKVAIFQAGMNEWKKQNGKIEKEE